MILLTDERAITRSLHIDDIVTVYKKPNSRLYEVYADNKYTLPVNNRPEYAHDTRSQPQNAKKSQSKYPDPNRSKDKYNKDTRKRGNYPRTSPGTNIVRGGSTYSGIPALPEMTPEAYNKILKSVTSDAPEKTERWADL